MKSQPANVPLSAKSPKPPIPGLLTQEPSGLDGGCKSAGDSGVIPGRGHTPLLFKVSFPTKIPNPSYGV